MVVLGLSGITNSGKSTMSKLLREKCGPKTNILCQDSYFLPENDPRHIHIESLNHHNWELLTALDMNKMRKDAHQLLRFDNNKTLNIFEGFLILNDPELSTMCSAKVFIDLPYDICKMRRNQRCYDPPDVPGYFEEVVWPHAVKSREEALRMNPETLLLDGTEKIMSSFKEVLKLLENKGLNV